MPDETEIQKLLRLKRYEQPPAGYYDKFLQDFHRRQRAELLRQPAWKIALERMETFFSEHSLGRYAYSGATAVVLLFGGILSYNMVSTSGPVPVAKAAKPAIQLASTTTTSTPVYSAQASVQTTQPHYVIDSRPVSYERPFSF